MPHPMHPRRDDCDVCTRRRQRMLDSYRTRVRAGLPAGDKRHGTANGYLNYGCRCHDCKEAESNYNSVRRASRAREDAL